MRQFNEKTSWQAAYDEVVYTLEACGADDELPGELSRPLAAQLTSYEQLESERRALWRARLRANARVRLRNQRLDRGVGRFANDVLHAVGGQRDARLYQRIFRRPPHEVIRLGLESEVPEVEEMLKVVAEPETPAAVKQAAEPLPALIADGKAALGERDRVEAELGRLAARFETWKEATNQVRLLLQTELTRIGAERGLGKDYAEGYFLAPTTRKRRGEEEDEE